MKLPYSRRTPSFFLFVNLGAFLVYYIVARLIAEQNQNMELSESNHRLAMQELQYEDLNERIAEARKAKHDVRHYITLIKEYLKNKEYDKLDAYLGSYQKSLPDDKLIRFCENGTVNAILLYFAQQAKYNKIDYAVKLTCSENIPVSEVDLSVLLGNLLENALDACVNDSVTGPMDKKIIIRGTADESSICIGIDNTFFGEVKQNRDDEYLSTKYKGHGSAFYR